MRLQIFKPLLFILAFFTFFRVGDIFLGRDINRDSYNGIITLLFSKYYMIHVVLSKTDVKYREYLLSLCKSVEISPIFIVAFIISADALVYILLLGGRDYFSLAFGILFSFVGMKIDSSQGFFATKRLHFRNV